MDRISMPIVARRLGVSHSTLYRYVHDRDDLLLAAVELAVSEFDWPEPQTDWRAALTGLADASWTFFERYPGMAKAIMLMPGTPQPVTEVIAAYLLALRSAGFSQADAVVALDFVVDLTLTSADEMAGMARVHEQVWSGRGTFDQKLEILLDGLGVRLERSAG